MFDFVITQFRDGTDLAVGLATLILPFVLFFVAIWWWGFSKRGKAEWLKMGSVGQLAISVMVFGYMSMHVLTVAMMLMWAMAHVRVPR